MAVPLGGGGGKGKFGLGLGVFGDLRGPQESLQEAFGRLELRGGELESHEAISAKEGVLCRRKTEARLLHQRPLWGVGRKREATAALGPGVGWGRLEVESQGSVEGSCRVH